MIILSTFRPDDNTSDKPLCRSSFPYRPSFICYQNVKEVKREVRKKT